MRDIMYCTIVYIVLKVYSNWKCTRVNTNRADIDSWHQTDTTVQAPPDVFVSLTSNFIMDGCCDFEIKTCFLEKGSLKNIAKSTTDPRVEFISQVIAQILIKQFQNFD